ncbi:uncharacterized protein LOC111400906 [Olea europaea var. sylvestris]|uniref:Eukaryotic translation initiation factor 5B-like n=1 Tax=Olea europaea subsp. europaea TaxID=158383 RepID=A0A8S0SXX1_OLEEU|nr:uncharacterized protein LOC111400906 [Olea europaea var. sylvestris]CAA2996016.1 eukaryotic translation initiation factor 5B-like [Olea europaea subsp. europaea]
MGKISSGISGSSYNGGKIYSQQRRSSIGAYDARYNSRRVSTEKLDSANNDQESIPHYLRASTGSCHDFCKYGRKHAFEVKERSNIPKRTTKPPLNEQNSVEKTIPGEQKKKIVVNHKASSGDKSHLPENKSSPVAKSFISKPKPSLNSQRYSPEQKASPGNITPMQRHKPSSSKKTPSPYPLEIIKRETVLSSKTVEVTSKQGSSIDNNVPENEKTENVPDKHSQSVTVRLSSSPNTSDGIHGIQRRNNDVKTGGKILASKASVKKALTPLPACVSPKLSLCRTMPLKTRKDISLKLMSPLKDRNRIHKPETKRSSDENIPEKTLHVIRTDGHVIQSHPSPSALACLSLAKSSSLLCHGGGGETEYDESEVHEIISDRNDTAEVGEVKLGKEKHIKVRRKNSAVGSEDRDGTPVKLKFMRGKVVDLKSDHYNPRRLKFRRGRVLVEYQDGKGDLRRKTFKNGTVNDDKNEADPSSEKVVLKHQDVQGKKDAQGLFNNVIEETASKLVESRKSKVKALVGAFETVISLQ